MQCRLIIPETVYRNALTTLLPGSGNEGLVFFIAGKYSGKDWFTLTVRDVLLPSAEDLVWTGTHGIELSDEAKVRVILKARTEGLCLIEAHSHPGVRLGVTFSAYDWDNAREFVPYVHLKLIGRPYGALVFGQESVDGYAWFPQCAQPVPITEILVVGSRVNKVYPTSSISDGGSSTDREMFDRQLRAFGGEGQVRLEKLRVGIVGAGGIGSLVTQQLVYLGVNNFSLIDDDTVETTNLNRLVGANRWDVSTAKVAVLGRLIQTVSPLAKVNAIRANVREPRSIQAVSDVDVIFGCTDSDSSRLILNELATSLGIPYVDTATGIESIDGRVQEAGGRVVVVVPDFSCLLCSQEIDLKEAHDELTSPEELEFRRSRGYASENIESPSVISLNGVMASLAVTEFLAMTTGIKGTVPCLYYYADKNSLRVRRWMRDPKCLSCANRGVGDQARFERYSSKDLPVDLPN